MSFVQNQASKTAANNQEKALESANPRNLGWGVILKKIALIICLEDSESIDNTPIPIVSFLGLVILGWQMKWPITTLPRIEE